jgi:endonuclease G, mitochondrial
MQGIDSTHFGVTVAKTTTKTAATKFGKFASFGEFIESYRVAEQRERAAAMAGLAPAKAIAAVQQRNVVEVNATITVKEPDDNDPGGGKHHRFIVHVVKILTSDPDVATDLNKSLTDALDVFVAVRIGDSLGIAKPIPGLKAKLALHLKGEWIPKAKAQAHGGRKMSVLHFTHHPLGFICTPAKCFS